jgi:hypothetical protein
VQRHWGSDGTFNEPRTPMPASVLGLGRLPPLREGQGNFGLPRGRRRSWGYVAGRRCTGIEVRPCTRECVREFAKVHHHLLEVRRSGTTFPPLLLDKLHFKIAIYNFI